MKNSKMMQDNDIVNLAVRVLQSLERDKTVVVDYEIMVKVWDNINKELDKVPG